MLKQSMKIIQLNNNLYSVDTGYACFGILTDGQKGIIIETAPIGKWMLGKNIKEFLKDES